MILSGLRIKEEIERGRIKIDPFDERQLNPNSYNLRLHDKLVIYDVGDLDARWENPTRFCHIPDSGLYLNPGELYLARTVEHTETDGFVPLLEGRSSIGRLGLSIHVTAGFGDVGFKGYWTLEMHVIKPVRVYAGMEICQIYYHTILGDYVPYHNGKYQDNKDIQPSMMWKEFGFDRKLLR